MTLTLNIRPELQAELEREAAREGLKADEFIRNTLEARLRQGQQKAVSSLSRQEAELLQKINQGLPETVWDEYKVLVGKRRAETLTPEEQERLIALSDQIEERNAERIGHLAELATLQNKPLPALMRELGIVPRT